MKLVFGFFLVFCFSRLRFCFGFEVVYNKYGFNLKLNLNSAPPKRQRESELELGLESGSELES